MSHTLTFDQFTLHRNERQLLADGKQITLGARAFDVLAALVERAGEMVSKNQLIEQVWPGLVVEENNLQVHISTLRKLVGAERITTVPGRGYRFVGSVQPKAGEQPEVVAVPAAATTTVARSVAVLPFANLSDDPSQEYFSDGLAEDIIAKLSHSTWLFVIARNSSFAWRSTKAPVAEVCRELGARYLVTGSVRRSGTVVRVSADLVDGTSNETLWSQRFDRPLDDLFAVQNEISASIVSAVEPVYLRREEHRTRSEESQQAQPNLRHWEHLMRARWHFWRTTRENMEESRTSLAAALKEKPDDPATLSLMAFTHMTRVWAGWSSNAREELMEANRLALRAVRQNDTDSYAHFTLGTALSCVGNVPQAIAELEYSLALYPQFAAAAGELGRLLAFSGRTQEAVEYVLQAIDSSPQDPHLSLWVRSRAVACYLDKDYPNAVKYAMQAVAKRPDWFFNYYLLAACQAAGGEPEAGARALDQAKAYGPYSMSALKIGHPFTDPKAFHAFVTHLRAAGWSG